MHLNYFYKFAKQTVPKIAQNSSKVVAFLGLSILTISSFGSNLQALAQADLNLKSNSENKSTTNPKSCPDSQFLAEYFDNIKLEGQSVGSKCDQKIDMVNLRQDSVTINGKNMSANWSVRWTGKVNFEKSNYTFRMRSDDGSRLFIDDKKVIDSWIDQDGRNPNFYKADLDGSKTIKMEYYQKYGGYIAELNWEKTSNKEQNPKSCPDGQFLLEYFNGKELQGEVLGSRCENKIDFNQPRYTAPTKVWPPYNWSIRFTGKVNFEPGKYKFTMLSDDGSRLFIDNQKVIDSWIDQNGTVPNFYEAELSGLKTIKMDYYQTGGGSLAKLNWEKVGDSKKPVENPEKPKDDKKIEEKEEAAIADQCRYQWCPMPIPNGKNMSDELAKQLKEAKDEDEIDVYVIMKNQANLSEEYKIKDFKEQGEKTYKKLVDATKTQETLIKDLEKAKKDGIKLEFTSFYIVNAVRVTAKKSEFNKVFGVIRKNPEVRYLEQVGKVEFNAYGYSPIQIQANQAFKRARARLQAAS